MPLRARAVIVVVAIAIAGCSSREPRQSTGLPPPGPRPLRDVTFARTPARLERGRYLTEGVLQCFLCHSDRDWSKPGGPPLETMKGAGHVWEGRSWLVAPNITPDRETGAGAWTDDMFARAIREGIGHDGRVLHPQLMYDAFQFLADEDLASVIVYLRSLPPVRRALPKTALPKDRPPIPAPDAIVTPVAMPDLTTPDARGRYLVRIANCMACHTALESPLSPGFFGGGNEVALWNLPTVFSANLTRAPSGIGSYYNAALFRDVIRHGALKGRSISGAMPWMAFRNMTDSDLDDVFAYLQSRRPVDHAISNTDAPTPCPVCGQTHGLGDRNTPKIRQTVAADPSAFGDYAGDYRFDSGFRMSISTDRGVLYVQFQGGGPKVALSAISPTEFTAAEIPDVLSFVRDERGRVTGLRSNVDDLAVRIR
jgi:mono/diheme cytochrome c family protein